MSHETFEENEVHSLLRVKLANLQNETEKYVVQDIMFSLNTEVQRKRDFL